MGILDNSSTYYAKPKHRTYLSMAEENYDNAKNAILHDCMSNYTVVQMALSAVFYFRYIIDTFDRNDKRTEKRTEVLRSNNLATLLHYIREVMRIPIPNMLLPKATLLTSYYFALAEVTTDTFMVTKEEVHFCFKNLEICRKRALIIINELKETSKDENSELLGNLTIFEDSGYTL